MAVIRVDGKGGLARVAIGKFVERRIFRLSLHLDE